MFIVLIVMLISFSQSFWQSFSAAIKKQDQSNLSSFKRFYRQMLTTFISVFYHQLLITQLSEAVSLFIPVSLLSRLLFLAVTHLSY